MADLEEGGLVSGVAGVLDAGWGSDGGSLSGMGVILEFQNSVVSRLLLETW